MWQIKLYWPVSTYIISEFSDHIANCVKCKNEKLTVYNFKVLKECNDKLETMINEAILIKNTILVWINN